MNLTEHHPTKDHAKQVGLNLIHLIDEFSGGLLTALWVTEDEKGKEFGQGTNEARRLTRVETRHNDKDDLFPILLQRVPIVSVDERLAILFVSVGKNYQGT